ncbi:MAG TPA: hypothetical protein VIN08_09665 [Ohtaekwangia sp.]|uniref:hypothetical protein n=1 Tax=Ohtaekwangia sp. TaxID=2066019 RepID=UPI002F953A4D
MSVINSIFNLLRFNRRNWKAVVLCLFAATVFWFFNALNKNYTTNISFPIKFDYDQDNYIAVRPLPQVVRINVTGMGWDLFRRSLGVKVPPLTIPLERPLDIKKIVGSTLPALFANQLERLEINFVLTDTLHVAIEPRGRRWISLAVDTPSILFRKGYVMTSGTTVEPDSIYIEGPWNLVKSISEPVYLKINQRNIDDNFQNDIEVKFLNDELIRRNPPTVKVSFEVDQLREITDSIQLVLHNMPKGARPSLAIRKLPCTFAIPQRYISSYHRDSLRAVVDLKSFSRGVKRVQPVLQGLPPYSRILKVDSVFVKF